MLPKSDNIVGWILLHHISHNIDEVEIYPCITPEEQHGHWRQSPCASTCSSCCDSSRKIHWRYVMLHPKTWINRGKHYFNNEQVLYKCTGTVGTLLLPVIIWNINWDPSCPQGILPQIFFWVNNPTNFLLLALWSKDKGLGGEMLKFTY